MLFMYLSSLHFGITYLTFATRSLKPLNNPVLKFYTGSVLFFALVLGIELKHYGICGSWGNALWNGLFETLCVSTTTGFAIIDNAVWPKALTMVIMFPASCAPAPDPLPEA
jgi:trk system potassium uptake protein TrkH